MSILTVIPVYHADALMAETLMDWILELARRKKSGSALIVCYGDVHEEMRIKLGLAAEAAYDSYDFIVAPEIPTMTKTDRVTHVFNCAADNICRNYKLPWLWLEPDSVPLNRGWLDDLDSAYASQGKKHFGPFFHGADRRDFVGRTSIFSPDLSRPVIPQFATNGNDTITPAAGRTKLIQQIYYKHPQDLDKIWPEARLLHSDKSGMLIQHLREKL
jgi:hypothetical protein